MYITRADGFYTFKIDCLDKPCFHYHSNRELRGNVSYTFKVDLVQ